ncbi:type III-A CRISPR-associated RAMP protein Csm5 [Desulfosoma caldarium]|uniref:type III-A CRISPR-associated RAMP protein Csm5 n=1 Tax=Desulfosoma caldarium TaxID=610254 RepID=UPI001475CD75|nr:type III-A CRISPR-associated RAMP protein Csm5 [Desulfosoma caldarium]
MEKLVVHLMVVSPIHIGTREGALLPMEYLFDGHRVHVVDESKLGRFLMQRNLMDRFVFESFSGNLRRVGLSGFLKQHARGVEERQIGPEVAAYSVPGGGPDMAEFRPFTRDGFGRVYLPATSIKGVLRTAFLYASLKSQAAHAQGKNHPLETQVKGWIQKLRGERSRERAKKFLSADLQREVLQSWNLKGKPHDQNKDILRCLKVRDAYPLNGKVQTRVIPIRFLSKRGDGTHYWSQKPKGGGDLVIWVEAVVGGTFVTEISWDHQLFEMFQKENPKKTLPLSGKPSPKQVLLLARRMNQDVLGHETAFLTDKGVSEARQLRSWYQNIRERTKGSLFRIGFGSGMLSTTVNLLWSDGLRQDIRNVCGHDRGQEPAPKSRRVWVKSETQCLPMGWAAIMIPGAAPSQPSTPKPGTGKASGPGNETEPGMPTSMPPKPAFTPKTERPTEVPGGRGHGPGPTASPVSQPKPSPPPGLLGKAQSVHLTDKLAMERLLEQMEEADDATAKQAARALKERLQREGLWKSTPFRVDIEAFLQDE